MIFQTNDGQGNIRKYWVGVVSLAHVNIGLEGGFCQFNHGKRSPVERLNPGDRLVYYSPRETMRGGEPIQAFTAIGEILPSDVYQVDFRGFKPYRRDVGYFASSNAPIKPMLQNLEFTKEKGASWGQVLRQGFFEISENDFELISSAMEANLES